MAAASRVQAGLASRRSAAAAGARVSSAPRRATSVATRRSVEVFAGKGKGGGRRDKAAAGRQRGPQMQAPDIPVDPNNPQFVIFVRSKKLNMWYPLNVVTAGTQAKMLMQASENELGKKLYGNQLPKQIGAAIYRDIDEIEKMAKNQYKPLASATELVYGFKVLDPEDTMASIKPDGITPIPPEEETKGLLENAKASFDKMFSS